MAYTPPAYNAVNFDPGSLGAYVAPASTQINFEPSPPRTANADIYEADDTLVATGGYEPRTANADIYEDDDTLAAGSSGHVDRTIHCEITERDDRLVSSGKVHAAANAAIYEADDTLVASTRYGMYVDITEEDDTLHATTALSQISSGVDPYMSSLARDNLLKIVIVEVDYIYESGGEPKDGTLTLSDKLYFDPTDVDSPAHAYIDCVKSIPSFTRSLSGDRLGQYSASYGSVELDNADGDLDFILDLAIDGSDIRFYLGFEGQPRTEFELIFSALSSLASATSRDRISIQVRDLGIALDKNIGGTLLVGGTGPNANQPRPVNFGFIHNEQPLVVDAIALIYAHSDTGADTTALAVRDKGEDVDGFTDLGDGTFQLDTNPQGTITCDVLAEPGASDSPATGGRNVSDAMYEFVGKRAGLIDAGKYRGAGPTFIEHDDDDYLLGIHIDDTRNLVDLLSAIVDSGNCFWAILRTGEFTFGRLRPNDIDALVTEDSPGLTVVTIPEDMIKNGTVKIEHLPTQYSKLQAYMSKNWVVQTDLALGLTPDEAAVWQRSGIYDVQPDGIGTGYNDRPELYNKSLVPSPIIETLLSGAFDELDLPFLQIWMETRRQMFLPWIEIASITVPLELFELELGDPVLLMQPRFGEDEGTLFQVMSINIRLTDGEIDLRLVRRRLLAAPPDGWERQTDATDAAPSPYTPGRPFINPPGNGDPPPIWGGGGVPGNTPISIDRDLHLGLNFRPTGSGKFWRPPPDPTPDHYLYMRPVGGAVGSFKGDSYSKYGGPYMTGVMDHDTSVPDVKDISNVTLFTGVNNPTFDTDNKYEYQAVADGGGVFKGPAFGVPCYLFEMSYLIDATTFPLAITSPPSGSRGFIFKPFADPTSGNFRAAIDPDFDLRSYVVNLVGVDYTFFVCVPSGVAPGLTHVVGITSGTHDVPLVIGGVSMPPVQEMDDTSDPFNAGKWPLAYYRLPPERLNSSREVFVSGWDITDPISGHLVETTLGTPTVDIGPGTTPVVSNTGTVNMTHGVAITPYQIAANNSPATYGWSRAGGLPSGLSLDSATGLISGTPASAGLYTNIFLTATNGTGTGTSAAITFSIL